MDGTMSTNDDTTPAYRSTKDAVVGAYLRNGQSRNPTQREVCFNSGGKFHPTEGTIRAALSKHRKATWTAAS